MSPKRKESHTTAAIGTSAFQLFVERELGWIYRPVHQEHDFGIDGYIDIVTDARVTGLSLAVQIKTGDSYTKKTTLGGLRYDGAIKHLNYYCNLRQTTLLIVMDARGEKGWWVDFQLDRVQPGSSGTTWWIEVPRKNRLMPSVADAWRAMAGTEVDAHDLMLESWRRTQVMTQASNLLLGIDPHSVMQADPEILFRWQADITKTHEMTLEKRASVEFFIPGYDDDPRELYEIPEVRNFFQAANDANFPWIYWLHAAEPWTSYKLLLACSCVVEEARPFGTGHYLKFDSAKQSQWLVQQYHALNLFAQDRDISKAINKEISHNVTRFLKATQHDQEPLQDNDEK